MVLSTKIVLFKQRKYVHEFHKYVFNNVSVNVLRL